MSRYLKLLNSEPNIDLNGPVLESNSHYSYIVFNYVRIIGSVQLNIQTISMVNVLPLDMRSNAEEQAMLLRESDFAG